MNFAKDGLIRVKSVIARKCRTGIIHQSKEQVINRCQLGQSVITIKNRLNKISRGGQGRTLSSLCKLSISDMAEEIKEIWRQIWELRQKIR